MADDWQSPTGHNDPNSKWTSETNVYDDNTTTKATGPSTVGAFLELLIDALSCDKIRMWVNSGVPTWDIDLYYNGQWNHLYEGSMATGEWVEHTIGSTQTVTKARVTITDSSYNWFFEFDFNQVAGGGEVALAGVVNGVATISGETKVSKKIAGGVTGVAQITGMAKINRAISGIIKGIVAVVGSLTITEASTIQWLAGEISGRSSVVGSMIIERGKARYCHGRGGLFSLPH